MKKCDNCENELSGKQKRFCSTHCKNVVCGKEYQIKNKQKYIDKRKEYYDSHTDEIKEQKKEYYQRHKEKLKAIRRQYHKDNPEVDAKYKKSPKGRLMIYQRGARVRNLVFELDLDYFKNNWNKECVYCGDTINGIGIDRIDSDVGYTKDNTVMCCEMCNKMKLNHSKQDFINQCIKITNNLK